MNMKLRTFVLSNLKRYTIMNYRLLLMTLGMASFLMFGCKNTKKDNKTEAAEDEQEIVEEATEETVYEAELSGLNTDITGSETKGTARFVVNGNTISVTIEVEGAPANVEHWQHFHGFANGDDAQCPTADQDENGDGIIDLIETEAVSGTTMVPFNVAPAEMDIPTDTYPVADEDGNYYYETEIDKDALAKAFGEAFDGQNLDLDKRVLFIHGVAEDTKLPESVQSLGPIPAQTTIPIACGKINKVN